MRKFSPAPPSLSPLTPSEPGEGATSARSYNAEIAPLTPVGASAHTACVRPSSTPPRYVPVVRAAFGSRRAPVVRGGLLRARCRWQARRCAPIVRGGIASRRVDIRPAHTAARLIFDWIVWPAVAVAVFAGWLLLPVLFGPDAG